MNGFFLVFLFLLWSTSIGWGSSFFSGNNMGWVIIYKAWICLAVVVEWSRASYLIGVLGMLKIKGSNPASSILFWASKSNKNQSWYFRWAGGLRQLTTIACLDSKSFCINHPWRAPRRKTFGGQGLPRRRRNFSQLKQTSSGTQIGKNCHNVPHKIKL